MSTPRLPTAAPAGNQAATPPPLNFLMVLRQMLRTADNVSDLLFSPGRPPQVELSGQLRPVAIPGLEKLLPGHTAAIAKLILGTQQMAIESLEKSASADLSFSFPGESRFRVN